MQYHYINQYATLPKLRIELINDGRYDYGKSYIFNNAIQNADVTFTMRNIKDDTLKISKAPCSIILVDQDSCDERYIIEYEWKKRDTNEKGEFIGRFDISFKDDLKEEGIKYDKGDLIVPIYEELCVMVK